MNLTVSFFSTKYMTHAAGCPRLPHQMKLHFCSMDELPCYGNNDHLNSFDDEDDVNSNDSEFCANDSDERLESSTCDSMESDNISCAVKSATDNVLVGDHLVFGCPLENESSSMAGTLEEHMEPSHQFSVDVNGSTMNISNELSRPCEEIWIEDDRNSFRVFEEHRQPIAGVHASENELMMVSQEILPSCQSPADVPAPTENDLNEHLRLGEESTIKELRDSFPIIEENVLSFEHAGPSERQQSSMVDFVSVVENPAKKDNITCIIIDDITEEQSLPTRVPSPIRFVKHVRACKNKGMEVIDLCTPSPEFRITTGSKKRRVISDFPHLIDLTSSPTVAQL